MEEGFLRFYGIYPRKVGKLDAAKAWQQMRARGYDENAMIEGAEKFARMMALEGKELHYIPYPASWLRAGRWMDGELQETIVPTAAEIPVRKVQSLDELKAALMDRHGNIPPNLAPEIARAKSLADLPEFLQNTMVLKSNVTPIKRNAT